MAGYGYAYNWGFIHPSFAPLTLVPRPPRPGVVKVAVILTYLGVGLSAVYTVISIVSLFVNRNLITSQVSEGLRADPQVSIDLATVTHAAVWLGVVVSIIEWILPAAGAVVCAILTGRGANPARIVLASLMGFYALVNLCGSTFSLVSMGAGSVAGEQLTVPTSILRVVLAALAVTIGVLLLVPSANRYFSAGPGRRFAPST
ncbi:hypothetical protein [Rugosimonospora africana]|nr:hypothetical protein [Rugosimonospora africana]